MHNPVKKRERAKATERGSAIFIHINECLIIFKREIKDDNRERLVPLPLQVALSFLNDVDNDCDNHYQHRVTFYHSLN